MHYPVPYSACTCFPLAGLAPSCMGTPGLPKQRVTVSHACTKPGMACRAYTCDPPSCWATCQQAHERQDVLLWKPVHILCTTTLYTYNLFAYKTDWIFPLEPCAGSPGRLAHHRCPAPALLHRFPAVHPRGGRIPLQRPGQEGEHPQRTQGRVQVRVQSGMGVVLVIASRQGQYTCHSFGAAVTRGALVAAPALLGLGRFGGCAASTPPLPVTVRK